MGTDLFFGITESGVMHTDADPQIPLETKFKMVRTYARAILTNGVLNCSIMYCESMPCLI